jgi:hypothetical protein
MNKTFFMALMLASGMALAQSSGSMDQSQPSSQQSQPSTQQSQPSAQQNPPSTSPSSSSSLTGCLKGSDGAWVIVAQGQSTPVKGDSSTLSPHNGHQVQVKGQQASDGSFQVTDVVMIAETCPSQQSDASSGAAAGAVGGAAQRSVRYITDQNPQGSPSSDQSNPSGQTSNPSGQTTTPSGTTQPTNPAGQSTTPSSTGDQTTAGQKLPQTASPLPLLGLLGLGSLVSGLIARRKK